MIGRLCKSLLAVACVLCCVALAPALAAAAEPNPGAIAGTATEAGVTPTPAEGAKVCAYEQGGAGSGGCALTDAGGHYRIQNLSPGEYEVQFNGQKCEEIEIGVEEFEQICASEWAEQFWQDIVPGNPPTLVEVEEGLTTENIDAELEALGGLGGTITSPGGPIAKAIVCVDGVIVYHPTCALTDSSGEYAVGGLPPAEYFIEFTGLVCDGEASECLSEAECLELHACTRPYVAQYNHEQPSFEQNVMTPVLVESRNVTAGVDATLVPGGRLKGRVTVAALGSPVAAGVTVCASSDESLKGGCSTVDANGEWEFEGLASGSWFVHFASPCTFVEETGECIEPPFVDQFYDGETEEGEATHIQLTAPETVSGIDAAMVVSQPTMPAFTASPVLSGNPSAGETLYCSGGAWSNYPTSITYTWQRSGIAIAGQAGSTYVVTSADEGSSLNCEATIENQAGAATESSNALSVPTKEQPSNPTNGTSSTASTSTGPSTSPTPTTPEPAPKAGTAVAAGDATVKGGKAMVSLKCNGGACKGSLKLVYEVKTKNGKGKTVVTKVTIGSVTFSLAAGTEKSVVVKLNSDGTSYLAEAGKKGLKVKLSGSGVKGRTVQLKPAV